MGVYVSYYYKLLQLYYSYIITNYYSYISTARRPNIVILLSISTLYGPRNTLVMKYN